MQTKERLLLYLDQNRDRFVSGEELGEQLSVSRSALWQALRSLRIAGYTILSEQGQGYRLAESCEVYTAPTIQARLADVAMPYTIEMRRSLPSTNRTLREMAQAGAPAGTVLIAKRQTAGYGRKQRTFFSQGGGIYMSLLLRPQLRAAAALTLTTTAAVAVVDAIRQVVGREAAIKWVNDVYLDGKKVCGILTESSLTPDGNIDYAILGIGINVFPPVGGFPQEIRDIATALLPEMTPMTHQRSDLVVALLRRLAELLPMCHSPQLHAAYCRASFLVGRTVTVLREDGTKDIAVVIGIDEHYRLLVRYPSGKCDALFSGEVSISPGDFPQ